MKLRVLLVFMLALGVSGCGVKSDLQLPDGSTTPKGEKDPSKPPAPTTGK
jgi:predicted small lipoprotein YifL